MYWHKRDVWKAGSAIAGIALFLILIAWVPLLAAGVYEHVSVFPVPGTAIVQTTSTVDATVAAETAKENLLKLQRDNERSLSAWFQNSGAALFSTLVIVIGALFGFWRWRVNRRDAQDKELADRRDEREKRVEERFQAVVEGLGSSNTTTQVGAAIMLRTFLRTGYEQFYSQAFDLAVAYLRLRDTSSEPEPPDSLNQALIRVFRESFLLARDLPEQSAQSLDALGIKLDGAYLVRSDLSNARMPESYLRKANLSAANLRGVNLRDANLRGANLSAVNFSGAKLRGADLSGANLGGTNFSGANLKGAKLYGVRRLTKAQLEACNAEGIFIDEDSMNS